MAKKLLILGNGFDIDLGLKTRYSNFANSDIWKTLIGKTYNFDQDLLGALRDANEKRHGSTLKKQ